MGNFCEKITLVNGGDQSAVERGFMPKGSIRQTTVSAVVDTGATTVVIDEPTRLTLGLSIIGSRWITFANGTRQECGITEPVTVRWNERDCSIRAVVIPGAKVILLGAIPLEDMDLKVDPVNKRLERAHGDSWETLALTALPRPPPAPNEAA